MSDERGRPAQPPPVVRRGRLRRSPRYGAFTATGVVVGLLVAVVLTSTSSSGRHGTGAVLGLLAVVLGLLGGLLGALAAVLAAIALDRRR